MHISREPGQRPGTWGGPAGAKGASGQGCPGTRAARGELPPCAPTGSVQAGWCSRGALTSSDIWLWADGGFLESEASLRAAVVQGGSCKAAHPHLTWSDPAGESLTRDTGAHRGDHVGGKNFWSRKGFFPLCHLQLYVNYVKLVYKMFQNIYASLKAPLNQLCFTELKGSPERHALQFPAGTGRPQ